MRKQWTDGCEGTDRWMEGRDGRGQFDEWGETID